MREDPTVGRQAPFVERSPLKEVLEPSTLTILVFAGECRPCIEPQLYEWQDLQAKFSEVKIVLGAQNSAKDIAKQRANMKLTLPIGADPDGQMAHAYNAVWSPRAYGIASDGTLAWIQDEPRMSAAGVAPRFLNQRR